MARRQASAQLIHAQAGSAAPLTHASVGPNAQLISGPSIQQAGLISAPQVRGGYGRGGSVVGTVTSPGGRKDEKDKNAPKPVAKLTVQGARGSGFMNRGQSGRTETVASIGSQQFNAAQVKSAIDRGQRGQRLSRNDQAIYDAHLAQQKNAEEEAKAKAKLAEEEMKRQQEMEDWKAKEDYQNQLRLKQQEAQASLTRLNAQRSMDYKANLDAEAAAKKKADEDAAAKARADQAEAEEDAWNERYGVEKGTRLSNNEKKLVEEGKKKWGYSESDRREIDSLNEDYNNKVRSGFFSGTRKLKMGTGGNLIEASPDDPDAKTEREWAKISLDSQVGKYGKRLVDVPKDPSMPNIQEIGGEQWLQEGNSWRNLDAERRANEQKKIDAESAAKRRADQERASWVDDKAKYYMSEEGGKHNSRVAYEKALGDWADRTESLSYEPVQDSAPPISQPSVQQTPQQLDDSGSYNGKKYY